MLAAPAACFLDMASPLLAKGDSGVIAQLMHFFLQRLTLLWAAVNPRVPDPSPAPKKGSGAFPLG